MFSFDAHAFGLLIALAMATAAFVISLGAVPVVRAIRVVRVVPLVSYTHLDVYKRQP